MIRPNPTLIPSYLGSKRIGGSKGRFDVLDDTTLRLGEVKRLIYPKDDLSYGKKNVEYEVEVRYRDGTGDYTSAIYKGVSTSNLFGGGADRFAYTLRPDSKDSNKDTEFGVGSKVLLLCLAGDQQKAIILGGIEDPEVSLDVSKDQGHNLFFEFNGVRFTIDKEGQPTFLFRGATDVKGKLVEDADEEAEGTTVKIEKDGSLTVATKDEAQYIKLNHTDKVIDILADEHWRVTSNKKMTMSADQEVVLRSDNSKVDVEASSNINLKSSGVMTGDATDATILGDTYRNAESQRNKNAAQSYQQLAMKMNMAGAFMTVAAQLMKVPQVGAAAASSLIDQAAQAFIQAGQAFAQISGGLNSLEGQASQFLSKKNKSD